MRRLTGTATSNMLGRAAWLRTFAGPRSNFLARLEAEHGGSLAALEYVTLAIRNYHDSGNTTMMGTTLAVLAAFSDRLGRYELAATIAGFDCLGATAITGHRQTGRDVPSPGHRRASRVSAR